MSFFGIRSFLDRFSNPRPNATRYNPARSTFSSIRTFPLNRRAAGAFNQARSDRGRAPGQLRRGVETRARPPACFTIRTESTDRHGDQIRPPQPAAGRSFSPRASHAVHRITPPQTHHSYSPLSRASGKAGPAPNRHGEHKTQLDATLHPVHGIAMKPVRGEENTGG